MIFGCLVEAAVGLLCVVLGLLVWLKKKVSILHDYHYNNVQAEDLPAYTRQIGIGLNLIGVVICVTGLLNLLYSPAWWVPLAAGILLGLLVMHKAQMKYNGSWFS